MATKFSKNPLYLIALIGVMAVSACQPKAAPASEAPAPTTAPILTQQQILTIGVVSDDPAGTIEGFQPMMDYVAKQLADYGIQKGEVVVVPDFATLAPKLRSGEVDLFYETVYGALYMYDNAGAVPLLRGSRKGINVYHSTIFVRKDSGVSSLEGLQGKLIAFAEPDSTSGFFLPKAFLTSSGLTVTEKPAAGSVPSDQVGYLISGSDENVVSNILFGTATGGALEYDVYDGLKQADKDQLRVLAQTQDVPRSLLMASPTMPAALRAQLKTILKAASQSEEGKAALAGASHTTGFDDFPLGAQATLDSLQAAFGSLQ